MSLVIHSLIVEQITTFITPIELLSVFLSAVCHDLDHPGVNQNYLVNTSSYLAAIHGVSLSLSVFYVKHCPSFHLMHILKFIFTTLSLRLTAYLRDTTVSQLGLC